MIRENKYLVEKEIDLFKFVLSNCLYIHSEQEVMELLASSRVLINGQTASKNILLKKEDIIIILTPRELEPKVKEDFSILFEDEYFFAVNKPAPLPIHPAGKYYFNTLTNLLEESGFKEFYPVNRLDRETTGVVLFAKTKEMAKKLGELFLKKEVQKTYVAVCCGTVGEDLFKIDLPLIKKNIGEFRNHVVVDENGKQSLTEIKKICSNELFSILEVKPLTGRSHQIRVHLSSIGFPIVGDKEYGLYPELFSKFSRNILDSSEVMEKLLVNNHLLHCKQIQFNHPQTGKEICIKAPLFEEMKEFIMTQFNDDLLARILH
ncbi:MAG: RluA family pseudouridine synthase [Candidatus Nanoarchaeia archaeon]|nr:RluA family pseudouridine synthase [Candidatus Nanoarchaeia archaeon]